MINYHILLVLYSPNKLMAMVQCCWCNFWN